MTATRRRRAGGSDAGAGQGADGQLEPAAKDILKPQKSAAIRLRRPEAEAHIQVNRDAILRDGVKQNSYPFFDGLSCQRMEPSSPM